MSSNSLPPTALDLVPTLLEDETIFSWCSLYHRLCGTGSPAATSMRLFGSPTSGFVRDFPARLDHLASATEGLIGSAEQLVKEHTLYAFYAPFRAPETMQRVTSSMRGPSVARVKFLLGLHSSRAGAVHPLKFCPECVAEEMARLGAAHWNLYFQLPTVWVCEQHGRLLERAGTPYAWHCRKSWLLPSDVLPQQAVRITRAVSRHFEEVATLNRLTTGLLDRFRGALNPQVLHLVFLAAAKDHDWIAVGRGVKSGAIRDEFLARYGWMKHIPGFDFIESVNSDDCGFLGNLFRGAKGFLHPAKYLLTVNMLFPDVQSFLKSYDKQAQFDDYARAKLELLHPYWATHDTDLRRLIVTDGKSLNYAASELGLPIHLVMSWAHHNDIGYRARPRLESVTLLGQMRALISRGAGRGAMAAELGVRRRWLTNFFRRHPELHEAWRSRRESRERHARRSALQRVLKEHKTRCPNDLAAFAGSNYKWLLTHDRDWLNHAIRRKVRTAG